MTTGRFACLCCPGRRSVTLLVKLELQAPNGAQIKVAIKDVPHSGSNVCIYHQTAVIRPLPHWWYSTHPHAAGFRSCDLVANAFCRHFPLKLGERQQHVESQSSHTRCCVELLSD